MRSFASLLLVTLIPAAAASAAPSLFDRIVVGVDNFASEAELPAGEFSPIYQLSGRIGPIVFLPDGRQLGISEDRTLPDSRRMLLQEIGEDGSLRLIGKIDPLPQHPLASEFARDLGVDRQGRLFLLSQVYEVGQRITELRPGDASTVSTRLLAEWATGLAESDAGGFWTFDTDRCMRSLDPDTGRLGEWRSCHPLQLNTTNIGTAATDSSGWVYFTYSYVCSPPCGYLGRIDPATGELRMNEFAAAFPGFFPFDRVAIRRPCVDSATARCLAGGRFRAEVEFAAYDGAAGEARVAPAGSPDTAIFSFFDLDNWELMVKALDGCAINQHFWVYSSASTDVAYTMTITDTQTGAQKIYQNPLGVIARTVTDNTAFPCSP